MNQHTLTILQHILDVLKYKPFLCTSFSNLCKEVELQLLEDNIIICDRRYKEIKRAIVVGELLGIIGMNGQELVTLMNLHINSAIPSLFNMEDIHSLSPKSQHRKAAAVLFRNEQNQISELHNDEMIMNDRMAEIVSNASIITNRSQIGYSFALQRYQLRVRVGPRSKLMHSRHIRLRIRAAIRQMRNHTYLKKHRF